MAFVYESPRARVHRVPHKHVSLLRRRDHSYEKLSGCNPLSHYRNSKSLENIYKSSKHDKSSKNNKSNWSDIKSNTEYNENNQLIRLPFEIQCKIIKNMDFQTHLNLSKTCSYWRDATWLALTEFQLNCNSLSFSKTAKLTAFITQLSKSSLHTLVLGKKHTSPYKHYTERSFYELITQFKHLKGLRSLTLQCCPDGRSIVEISNLKSLRKLELIAPYKGIEYDQFKCLFDMTQLTSLSLFRATQMVHNEIAILLRQLVYLKELDLQWSEISDESLMQVLPHLKELEELNISECCYSIKAELPFKDFPGTLKRLYLRNNARLSEESLKQMEYLTNLELLDLTGVDNVTNEVLRKVSKLTSLRTLYLPRSGRWNDNGIHLLSSLTKLKSLSIPSTKALPYVSNSSLLSIGKFEALEQLTLSSIGITDDGLQYLRNLTNLVSLNISRCVKISHGLDYLPTHLTALDISNSGVLVSGCGQEQPLKLLTRFPNLTCLFMRGHSVLSQDILEMLLELKSLKVLRINKVQAPSIEFEEEMLKKNPGLSISWNSGDDYV